MKIAFIDAVHDSIKTSFIKLGWEVLEWFDLSRDELKENLLEIDGIILRSRIKMDADLLQYAKKLRFIGRPGAGLENIDCAYCQEKGIKVFRSPEGNRDALAEHAMGMLLMLLNNLKRADNEVREGVWRREENRGHELMGKTVGIIGYGYMGEAFAKRLTGFQVKLIAHDKYKKGFGKGVVKEVSLEELKLSADIISLHVPLTDETIGMVGEGFLSSLSGPVYLINTARGPLVQTKPLIDALHSGKVLGACLDVFEQESSSFEKVHEMKKSMRELRACNSVLLSPHIAGWTHQSKEKMAKFLIEKITAEFGNH